MPRALVLAVLLCGCESGGKHAIIVEVRTDWVPGTEITYVSTTVLGGGARPPTASRSATLGEDYIAGVRIGELPLARAGQYTLETRLIGPGGEVLAMHHSRVGVEGTVVVKVVIPRTPMERCQTDEACTTTADCAEGVCVSETCLMAPIAGACADTEWCSPDDGGCVPIPGGARPPAADDGDGGAGPGDDAGTLPEVDAGTMAPPRVPTAFRVDQITSQSPNIYAAGPPGLCRCVEVTSEIEDLTNNQVDALDRNIVFIVWDFPGVAGTYDSSAYTRPACSSSTSCMPATRPAVNTPTVFTSSTSFRSEAATVPWDFEGTTVDFTDVIVTGTLSGDTITGGRIRGFLTEEAARNANLGSHDMLCDSPVSMFDVLRGGDACASGDDRDGAGWWIELGFTARRITWSE